jgi:hypothetical protein
MDGAATRATAQGASSVLTASLTFIVLTALAMVEYPGGSKYELTSHHYLFFRNFLSDLGATKTSAGSSNTSSCVLFIVAMTCVGISLIAFSGSWHGIAERRGIAVHAAWVFKWSAIGSGICFIGIGATPWNLLPSEHNFFARGAFSLLLVFVLAMLTVQRRNRWPWPYVIANVAFVAVVVVYVAIVAAGPSLRTPGGLAFQVTVQKIMVYASVLNFSYQAHGVRNALAPTRTVLQVAHR